jgi:hypothetical protein
MPQHLRPVQRLCHVSRVQHAPVDEVARDAAVDDDSFREQRIGGADDTQAVPTPGVAAELSRVCVSAS